MLPETGDQVASFPKERDNFGFKLKHTALLRVVRTNLNYNIVIRVDRHDG